MTKIHCGKTNAFHRHQKTDVVLVGKFDYWHTPHHSPLLTKTMDTTVWLSL